MRNMCSGSSTGPCGRPFWETARFYRMAAKQNKTIKRKERNQHTHTHTHTQNREKQMKGVTSAASLKRTLVWRRTATHWRRSASARHSSSVSSSTICTYFICSAKSLIGFYLVLLCFTVFYLVLPRFTLFNIVLLCFTGFQLALLN